MNELLSPATTNEMALRERVSFYPHEKTKSESNRRPMSLRRTSEGGSARLTALSDLLQSFSLDSSRQSSLVRTSDESTLGLLNRLQYLLASKIPNIARLSRQSYTSDILVPRKTLDVIQANLDAFALASVVEIPPHWQEKRRKHDFVREMALKKLESETCNKFGIVYNTHVASMKQNEDCNAPVNTPFSWTLEDFLRRREERNIGWLDTILLRSDKEFTLLKFKCDMEELSKLLQLIFKGLRPSANHYAKQELFTYINDVHEFLRFPHALRIDAKKNMSKLREQVNTYLDMWYYKRIAEEEEYKRNLEQKLMNMAVTSPIELRYQVNWLRSKTDQAIMKMSNQIEEMEKKAENLKAEEAKESYCARCALDMYYVDIESLKNRINELSSQYDEEFEIIDNECIYKRSSMDKLRAQRKYLEEQMERFKEEIEQLRQKELEEKEAEEERKRLEAQRLLEEELAKKKKKSKKGKPKKK